MESMLMAPRISVAMGTYNGSRYIKTQIASILSQSVSVDEIVISDDESSDETVKIVEDMFKDRSYPKLVILRGGRLGVTKNFERAVTACSGDIIFLCDQDDVWITTKVSKTLDCFQKNSKLQLVFSNAGLVNAEGQDIGMTQFEMVRLTNKLKKNLSGKSAFPTLLRRNVITGATVAFRKDLLSFAVPFVNGWLHDEWLAICAALKGGLGVVDESLVLYRQHATNHCGMRPSGLVEKVSELVQHRRQAGFLIMRLMNLRDRMEARSEIFWLSHLDSALLFETERNRLRNEYVWRLFDVFQLALRGGYFRYSNGFRGMVKDVLSKP